MKKKVMSIKREAFLLVFLFFSIHFAAFAQNALVTGTVTDNTGDPLPGVNVVLTGTTTGTITDINGKFSLDAPLDGTLSFNFIGFATQNINIDGRSSIIVVLQPSDISLDEIVVVGYGTMRKSDLTGAVVKVG
ncbi:MAG TPA: TonB-dependent receptor, partial [Marinilabiliaceae bacterium]|nr:TonB-dependent receptor [Marinilabiliaceae bacterium]